MKCDCEGRTGIEINSYDLFIRLKNFFEQQEQKGFVKKYKDGIYNGTQVIDSNIK